jgi:hypothetical protein
MNRYKYGQEDPPTIDLSKIQGSKIIQIGGTKDRLANSIDTAWLNQQLGSNVMYFKEYALGHMSFLLANDMTYFHDVLDLLRKNPWK